MSALSDHDYMAEMFAKGSLQVTPAPSEDQFQPASLDLRLGREFIEFLPDPPEGLVVDVSKPLPKGLVERHVADTFLLHPGRLVLGTTHETVSLPKTLLARVEGRSSLGRIGLAVHVTAGFIDPGFRGQITLEMYNLLPVPILLRAGMRVCQLAFTALTSPCTVPYQGKYQDQRGVQPSRLELDSCTEK
jgi:dCTP deaminase